MKTFSTAGLTNTAVAVSTGGRELCGWFLDNTENSATTFFQFFDMPLGTNLVLGQTVPKFSLAVPAGGSANVLASRGPTF